MSFSSFLLLLSGFFPLDDHLTGYLDKQHLTICRHREHSVFWLTGSYLLSKERRLASWWKVYRLFMWLYMLRYTWYCSLCLNSIYSLSKALALSLWPVATRCGYERELAEFIPKRLAGWYESTFLAALWRTRFHQALLHACSKSRTGWYKGHRTFWVTMRRLAIHVVHTLWAYAAVLPVWDYCLLSRVRRVNFLA